MINALSLRHVYQSVRPHVTRFPLDGFSLHLISEYFSKNCTHIKFKFHQNLSRIPGTSDEYRYTLSIISRSVPPRMRNVSDKICRKN